jgi:hypothetical protein
MLGNNKSTTFELGHDGPMDDVANSTFSELIETMIEAGRWPTEREYQLVASGQTVTSLAPHESEIRLARPPFHTLEEDNLDWFERFRHPDEIDFSQALVVGDFGIGSDNPIVLDYSSSPPAVKALTFSASPNPAWSGSGRRFLIEGHWFVVYPTLEEFVRKLGI